MPQCFHGPYFPDCDRRHDAAPPTRELPPWLTRLGRVLTAVELSIGVAALLLIFGLVLLQAGQRYLPIDGWPWTGELAGSAWSG